MNTYSICVFVRFQMWLYTQLLVDQTQKYFEYFICVLKVFLYFYVFRVFVQNVYFLFLSKNSFWGIFESKLWVSSSRENKDGKNKKHCNSYREFHDYLTRNNYLQKLMSASMVFSWVTSREAYPRKVHFCSF